MITHLPVAPLPGFLGTHRPLPSGVLRSVHRVPADGSLDCPGTPWADALAVLEAGCVELRGAAGGRLHLCAGAVFSLRGLTPAVLTACGHAPAVIHTLQHRTEGDAR